MDPIGAVTKNISESTVLILTMSYNTNHSTITQFPPALLSLSRSRSIAAKNMNLCDKNEYDQFKMMYYLHVFPTFCPNNVSPKIRYPFLNEIF